MTKVWQRHIEEVPTQKTAFRGKDLWQDFWRRPLGLCPRNTFQKSSIVRQMRGVAKRSNSSAIVSYD